MLPETYFDLTSIYYKKYLAIINTSTNFNNNEIFEKHHLIPVCYYKHILNISKRKKAQIQADKDPNNKLIVLTLSNHCLAHYYLCRFCINTELRKRLICAFLMMINFVRKYNYFLNKNDEEVKIEITNFIDKLNPKLINYVSKKCICIEKGLEFNSIAEANEYFNRSRYKYRGIYNVCAHLDNQQTALGYHWCFSTDKATFKKYYNLYNINKKTFPINAAKEIYCIELNKKYNSATEAAKYFNTNKSKILYYCTRPWLSLNNNHFCYFNQKDSFKIIDKPKRTLKQREYIGLKTKEAISNLSEDIKQIKIEKIKQYWNIPKHYYNNGINEIRAEKCPEGWIEGRLEKYKTKGKKIKCIELNKIFESIIKASIELNINKKSISNCLNRKTKTAGGYHWEFSL